MIGKKQTDNDTIKVQITAIVIYDGHAGNYSASALNSVESSAFQRISHTPI